MTNHEDFILLSPVEWEWLRSLPYKQYLQTSHWQRIRAAALRDALLKCKRCNSGGTLDVHHKNYDHLAGEDLHMEDIEVLCRRCHASEHGKAVA